MYYGEEYTNSEGKSKEEVRREQNMGKTWLQRGIDGQGRG